MEVYYNYTIIPMSTQHLCHCFYFWWATVIKGNDIGVGLTYISSHPSISMSFFQFFCPHLFAYFFL